MSTEMQEQTTEVQVKDDLDEAPQTTLSEWEILRKNAEEKQCDSSAWDKLLEYAENLGDLERIKEAYEAILQKYPNTSSVQISYLNHFLVEQTTFPYAETLFTRFLRISVSVDLWKVYIVYVRRLNAAPVARDVVVKAYEFALQHVGQDKDSSDIWSEYIQFIKSGETTSTWEEQQKMDNLRKVYQRAVQIPLENVETLWKDYEAFENTLNKITAKKFLQDLTPAHMQARSKLRELRKYLDQLFPPVPAPTSGERPPLDLPSKPTYTPSDRSMVGAWKQYLKWEESNPLEIEDKNAFNTRIQGVYRKAVIRMRFFSEIWFMAFSWTNAAGRTEEALQILKSGIEAIPASFVLNFALAEMLELAKNYSEVHATYKRLLQGVCEEIEAVDAKINALNNNTESIAEASGAGEAGAEHSDGNGASLKREPTEIIAHSSTPVTTETSALMLQLRERKQEYGLVYIMYIRFAMRAEGQESSRSVFQRARKDKYVPWEVFEAAALMEYHVAKQPVVANRILSVAMNRFSNEIDFVVRYLTFLMSVNDETNARALFERTVGTFPPDKARPLWERWARYEYQYGNLEAALKLEKRMAEVYPNDPPIKRFAQRHLYANIDGIANRDLGVSQARHSSGLSRADTLVTVTGATPSSAGNSSSQLPGSNITRAPSPEPRDRERERQKHDETKPSLKRPRDNSPPRDRSGDRWTGLPANKKYGSPAWHEQGERADRNRTDRPDRDRARSRSPPRRQPAERDERPIPPQILSKFIGQLPQANLFDGPVFRTDDLMQIFRNAIIPGSNAARPKSPTTQPPRPTRPPPDYGPYRGPNGRGGRF